MEVELNLTSVSENVPKQSKWSNEKLKNLWISLLNLESVSKACEDVELQGILLLLETTFGIFKNLKSKHDEAESAYKTVKHDLEAAKSDLIKTREELRRCKAMPCERCPELEKELTAHKKKLESNEQRIKSIVSILSATSNSEDSERISDSGQNTAVTKAYNLVSQILLGDENNHGTKRICQENNEDIQVRTPGKKKKKSSKEEIKLGKGRTVRDQIDFNLDDGTLVPETFPSDRKYRNGGLGKPVPETLCTDNDADAENVKFKYCRTLAPETLPLDIIPVNNGVSIVPETLCIQNEVIDENVINIPAEGDQNGELSRTETTPKKDAAETKPAKKGSPILGSSGKKSTNKHQYSYCSPQEDSSDECTVTSQTVKFLNHSKPENKEINTIKSPSLLKVQGISNLNANESECKSNNKDQEITSCLLAQERPEGTKKGQADFWKLKPTSSVTTRNSVEGGNRKLKQTTLTLACFPKRHDLSTLKEFNGGVRHSVSESDLLIDQINGDCDEETSLQLAIQESLHREENLNIQKLCKKTNIEARKGVESADDDDFVFESPNNKKKKFNYSKSKTVSSRKGDVEHHTSPKKKITASPTKIKDTDETLFLPMFTSTLKENYSRGRGVTEMHTENADVSASELLLKEIGCPSGGIQNVVEKQDISFDRIPVKVSTSPNYKYRRETVRKKEARQKLDGWDCEQCKNYYALAGENLDPTAMKQRLNQCSKHRDKFGSRCKTPPGYWDIQFPDTELSSVERNHKAK